MTTPTEYIPAVNFEDEETAQVASRSTVRTPAVDAELAAIALSIVQLINSITAIQRDDTELLDGIVKIHTLSTDVLALLGSGGFTIHDPIGWLTATNYPARDVVTQGTGTYVSVVAHTSGVFATDLAAGKWALIFNSAGFVASGIGFTPAGGIAASNVQGAIEELDSEALKASSNLNITITKAVPQVNLIGTEGSAKSIALYENAGIFAVDWIGNHNLLQIDGASKQMTLPGDLVINRADPHLIIDGTGTTRPSIRLRRGGVEKWHIYDDGSASDKFVISDGVSANWFEIDRATGTISALAGQIKFPATQNPSSNANTLDDYEEGDWTGSVGGSATYNFQGGKYTKKGRDVSITLRMQINTIGTGSTIDISGVPFSALVITAFPVFWFQAANSLVACTALLSSTTLSLYSATAAAASLSIGVDSLGSGCEVIISGTYPV